MHSSRQSQGSSALPQLRLYLLGPPEVVRAGHPVSISRRQARALLFRLASRLQPVSREHLCLLLWPDVPETTAHRNLSHLLTHLRRALPHPELLLSCPDHVALDPVHVWSDAAAFERVCVDSFSQSSKFIGGKTAGGEHPDQAGVCKALQQVIELYRGPFLDGFSLPANAEYEAWLEMERRSWEQRYLMALTALIEQLAAAGAYDSAIRYAQRYLRVDPLAEDVHCRLMELYASIGDRTAALRQFVSCAELLKRELGVEPSPASRAIYQAILEGRSPDCASVRPAWKSLPRTEAPLVGRQEAMDWLVQMYAEAQMGRGRVVLVSGEAGVGKSRLIRDFLTPFSDRSLILAGQCYPGGRDIPYYPIVQALRTILSKEARDKAEREETSQGKEATKNMTSIICASLPRLPRFSAEVWLAEAARLLPDLHTIYAGLPPPSRCEPEESRTRLFEALSRVVCGLANVSRFVGHPAPMILFLDDIHWADDATLAWLGYLGQQVRGRPLLVIGTYRTEEVEAVDWLRHTLSVHGVLAELKLAELGLSSVLELIRFFIGGRAEGEDAAAVAFAGRLTEATGGNPFFLLETLKALTEAGRLPGNLEDVQDFPLPGTVQEALEERIRYLSPQALQTLEAGAVLGLSFGFEPVELVAGLSEIEAMAGLDELVHRQLLEETPPGYRFHHELTRRTVETVMRPIHHQLLHRRAGRALAELQIDQPAEIARHFEIGTDARSALDYYRLAEQRAEALFAWKEAEEYQGRMLALIDQLDPSRSDPEYLHERGQILANRAHLHFLRGRLAERDADLSALAALAEASGDAALLLQALIHRVRYLNLDSQYEQAIEAAGESLDLADRLHDQVAHARLLAQVGFAHYFLGHPHQAIAALESALMAGAGADPEMRGRILHILGYVYFHLGDFVRSLTYQQEAYGCHQAIADHNRVAWDGLDIGALYLELGQCAEARRWLDESLALARRIGARPAEAYGLTQLGCWELHQGNYLTAADVFRESLQLQQELHCEHGQVAAEEGIGLALYHLGDLDRARQWLGQAAARARSIGHLRRAAEALVGLGLVNIAADQMDTARNCLREAVQMARVSKCQESLSVGLTALAMVERHSGDLARAQAYADEAVRIAQEGTLPACEMWGQMELGLALLAQGEPAAALQHTEQAVLLTSRAHEAWIGTEEVYRAHARVLDALGRREAADECRQRAWSIVEAKAGGIADLALRQHYLHSRSGMD